MPTADLVLGNSLQLRGGPAHNCNELHSPYQRDTSACRPDATASGGAGFSLHLVGRAARNCYRVLGRAGSRQQATPTGATPA